MSDLPTEPTPRDASPPAPAPGDLACDVVVLGAGAAGLMAAIRAAQRGKRVVVVEKNRKAAVKVLMSGGTRCNLTHDASAGEIADAFERLGGAQQARFLRPALSRLTPDALVALFEAEGLRTKIEPTGKVFPESDRALDVQRAMLRMVAASGARLALGEAVEAVDPADEGRYEVRTTLRTIRAGRVVIAVGGQSYPGCGTTGDGYAWAKRLGHRVVPPRPALAPLTSDTQWATDLQGVTLPDVRLTIDGAQGEGVLSRRGSLLFTHFGLSGPVAMDSSRVVTLSPEAGRWVARCDFFPALDERELLDRLQQGAGNRGVLGLVAEWAPRRLAESLVEQSEVSPDRRLAELSRGERRALVDACKGSPIRLTGSMGFKKAEVTAGGVDLSEVDPRTLASRVAPGVFFVGEVLDIDGPIGGYNFQAAFSTGALCGDSV
ncbi:MAG: NAD(P)/FAD-dependent oxidoreductase [Lacipirellulaceae bacterium]